MKRRKFHWLVCVNIPAALFVGTWLPLRMVLFDGMPRADRAVDAFFLVLIAVRFWQRNSTFTDRRDTKRKSAAKRYGSLAADLLTALPLVSVLDAAGVAAGTLFILKLLFLRRLFDARAVLDSYDVLHPAVARLVPMALVMPTVVHIIACGWVWLGSGTAGPSDDKVFEYGRAVYWTVTTLCTVGYGDIAGRTLPQMFYANVTMIIGISFFGYVLSNVASLVARLDAAREEYLTLIDKVEGFMRYNDLPGAIRAKVRAYYRYLWESRKGYDDSAVLSSLPQKLRIEATLHINAEIIDKVPVLKGADENLLRDIVLELKPLVIVPGDEIFRVGEPGDAMYFIHRGPVEIIAPDGKILATLQPGSFFGEMALLTANPRSATARAVEYCDLFMLSRDAFEAVLRRHPHFEKHVKSIAAERTQLSSSARSEGVTRS